MRFDVITLFPELFEPFLRVGITRRAFDSKQIEVQFSNPRTFAQGNYRRVDERPFGGGPGMLMMAEPLEKALLQIRTERADTAPVVFFSPVGQRMDQALVQRWAKSAGAIFVCGRYEGVDQRFIDTYVDEQISVGDFVLSGGELAAMVLLDAVARLQPGVLLDQESHQLDSFNVTLDGLLDCPHYTRPENWHGQNVPPVLMSGHHAQIERWRRDQRLRLTALQRPDLLDAARQAGRLTPQDEAVIAASVQHKQFSD